MGISGWLWISWKGSEISSTCNSVTEMDGAKPAEMRWRGRSRRQFKPLTKPPYKPPTKPPQSISFQANQREVKRRPRVYCDQPSTNCDNVTSFSQQRKLLIQKQCFNCTSINHRAEECHYVTKYSHCRGRHHSLICENIFVYRKPEHI